MKMITDKQKKFINDIKGVITENGINAIDALDLNKFTCYVRLSLLVVCLVLEIATRRFQEVHVLLVQRIAMRL